MGAAEEVAAPHRSLSGIKCGRIALPRSCHRGAARPNHCRRRYGAPPPNSGTTVAGVRAVASEMSAPSVSEAAYGFRRMGDIRLSVLRSVPSRSLLRRGSWVSYLVEGAPWRRLRSVPRCGRRPRCICRCRRKLRCRARTSRCSTRSPGARAASSPCHRRQGAACSGQRALDVEIADRPRR